MLRVMKPLKHRLLLMTLFLAGTLSWASAEVRSNPYQVIVERNPFGLKPPPPPPDPTPPGPVILPDRNFQMRLSGSTNRSYQIDISSNLTSWSLLTNIAYSNGLMPFIDTTATNAQQRFYRARLLTSP